MNELGNPLCDGDRRIIRAATAKQAYEIFLARGGEHGKHIEHWLIAEEELQNKQNREAAAKQDLPKAASGTSPSQPSRKVVPRKRAAKL